MVIFQTQMDFNSTCAHIGAIPCFCGILQTEGTYIFAEEKPEHPFTKTLEKIAAKIGKF